MVEPHSSNFRVITTNFWGVRIFRKFTVTDSFMGLNLLDTSLYGTCKAAKASLFNFRIITATFWCPDFFFDVSVPVVIQNYHTCEYLS